MSDNKILLLGLGKQGKAALYDLIQNDEISHVVVGDNSPDMDEYIESLSSDKVQGVKLDAADNEQVSKLMNDADVVVEMLPPQFAFSIAKLAVENGVNLVSTMYFNDPGETDQEKIKAREEALNVLDELAKDKGITLLPEMGMDPGLDLILVAQAISELDEVHELYSYGAGFPEYEAANNPLKYKFTWSVEGLLKSYLRPARILKDGNIVDIPAEEMFAQENVHLLEPEEFKGTLECFANGDALEYAEELGIKDSLKSMGRYICRWQGHRGFWEPMAKCGFLNEEPIEVDGKKVSPIKFVASLLKPQQRFWYGDNERDIAFVRVDARGIKDGRKICNFYQLIDKRNLDTGFTAMTRTVGFTASIGAQLILKGEIDKSGLISPIDIPLAVIEDKLKKRGMSVVHHVTPYEE